MSTALLYDWDEQVARSSFLGFISFRLLSFASIGCAAVRKACDCSGQEGNNADATGTCDEEPVETKFGFVLLVTQVIILRINCIIKKKNIGELI